MVISTNREPENLVFQSLLNDTLFALDIESKTNEKEFLTLLGNKLEYVVADIMSAKAKGTLFENTIECISGQRFPDIIAKKYYGVEVKTTKQNHWITTGNSVMEGTRAPGIERIYMLFGKMFSPIEFKCRPYEECLSDIVVTHSPRYLIDMDLANGHTIFDKLKIPYETLRKEINPVKPIINYYRQFLKPGEQVWWMDQEEPRPSSMIIKIWNNLPLDERQALRIKAMVYFPEVFSNSHDKFYRLAIWLINENGILCPNVRDLFTGGGQDWIFCEKKIPVKVPKIIFHLYNYFNLVSKTINDTNKNILSQYWGINTTNLLANWFDLLEENTKHMNLKFDLRACLLEK